MKQLRELTARRKKMKVKVYFDSSFASNTPVAGIALSATKLLIREPRAMN